MAIRDLVKNPGISLQAGPKLIIGLGNVGDKYDLTRHNAGFKALDAISHKFALGEFKEKSNLNCSLLETNISGEKVILAKPNTFMNKSGLSVVKLQNYFEVNDPDILVIYDDVDLEFGIVRTRIGGSSGGHNGIKSIEQVIGDGFAKVKIGIKNDHLEHQDTADFVLANFSRGEQIELKPILEVATDQAHNFITKSFTETSITAA